MLTVAPVLQAAPKSHNLPKLGDRSSGIVSLEKEREVGEEFLRSLRGQIKTVGDPVLKDYLEYLIYNLARHSELTDKRLELVIVDSPQLNAFAAPGGIVGVNLGLFLYGHTEDEMSAILAHELAHLSQRHFARQAEAAQKSAITMMAGLLASVILIAAGGSEAGMATMTTIQGLAQNAALKYSRDREAEADRVGILTLANADMDPRAMAYMFERLHRANRYNSRLPEFLLTHPVTNSRISDSYNQTRGYPAETFALSLDYQLMRARVQVRTAENAIRAKLQMRDGLNHGDPVRRVAAQYGLALALLRTTEFDEALTHIQALRERFPDKIALLHTEAEIRARSGDLDGAEKLLQAALDINPGNHPLTMALAETKIQKGLPEAADPLLRSQVESRPTDADVWYLYAEVLGLIDDTTGVHQARAEYFVLTGNLDQAIKQLEFAIPMVRENFHLNAKIKARLQEIYGMKDKQRRG